MTNKRKLHAITKSPEAPATGVPIPSDILDQVRALDKERQLLGLAAENAQLKMELVLKDVVQKSGLSGTVRCDLAAGLLLPERPSDG